MRYKKVLTERIGKFWTKENQEKLKLQSKIINNTYSWKSRSKEWEIFFDEARKLKN